MLVNGSNEYLGWRIDNWSVLGTPVTLSACVTGNKSSIADFYSELVDFMINLFRRTFKMRCQDNYQKSLVWLRYRWVLPVPDMLSKHAKLPEVRARHRNHLAHLCGMIRIIGTDSFCQTIAVSDRRFTAIGWVSYQDCAASFL